MESPTDDPPRVKLLASFGGVILRRPHDGQLRHVGGEKRIVGVPRAAAFDALLARMKSLFDPAVAFIKYQQPDEDLDALVSVVNDDDVAHMMEEQDKLTASNHLHVFLFSSQQQMELARFEIADERENERVYIDALNGLIDVGSPLSPDSARLFSKCYDQWSPSYYSPVRSSREFPTSPSRYGLAMGEFAEEYPCQSPIHHQSPCYMENVAWLPPVAVAQEKDGFANKSHHAHHVFEGSSICELCRVNSPKNPAMVSDPWYVDPFRNQTEQFNTRNENLGHFMNRDVKLDHEAYRKEQADYQAHQSGHMFEDPRVHLCVSGRVGDHYVLDGKARNSLSPHTSFYERDSAASSCINHEDVHCVRHGIELANEAFHTQQTVVGGPYSQINCFEDTRVQYGSRPSAYGADNLYQEQQNLIPIRTLRRIAQVPLPSGVPYDSSGLMMPNGGIGSGFVRSPQDGSPRLSRMGVENQIQNSWVVQNDSTSQRLVEFDASESLSGHSSMLSETIIGQDGRSFIVSNPVQCQPALLRVEIPSEAVLPAPTLVDDKLMDSTSIAHHHYSGMTTKTTSLRVLEEKNLVVEATAKEPDGYMCPSPRENQILNLDSNRMKQMEEDFHSEKLVDSNADASNEHADNTVDCLSFLPELIDSVKKAAIESAEVVKATVEANADKNLSCIPAKKGSSLHEIDPGNPGAELEEDGDSENKKASKIEPTTAEALALAKGLQTIWNNDLEEIRVLGSGTYGSVYHGKWKGSDVAIKRIKASCFAGRPSERERLIADFWKEALLLSSLHHPNVVSFYGVVRDGPDGSLATVTEFMVNGSLKQFLQKKDRTIDRRKRLIIAMDASFGMEYLHEKSIVHFDLKSENLLVNMRDPHRPICKIGDLGLSKVKQHTLVSGGVRGTLPWMAPELLSGKSSMVTEKIDVYSFGIVMWELLTGEEPYADMRCASVVGGIVNNTLRPQIPTWCDPEWKSLMESCWSSDPGERPSFSEISQKLRKMSAGISVKA